MRNFLQFLQEQKLRSMRGVSYSGQFGLPDLDAIEPDTPWYGHKSWSQLMKKNLENQKLQGPNRNLYAWKATLTKFKNLAEEAYSAYFLRKNGQSSNLTHHIQSAYPNVQFDKSTQTLYGFTESEIIGGYYPRVRTSDLNEAVKRGIFEKVLTGKGESFNLKIQNLNQAMLELAEQLKQVEKYEKASLDAAQFADELPSKLSPYLWKDSGVPRNTGAR